MPRVRKVRRYRENPFLKEVVENAKIGYKRIASKDNADLAIINRSTGELTGAAGLWYRAEVEKTEFLKIYADGLAGILGLKSPGKKVFILLYNQLFGHIGKTEIVLHYEALTAEERKKISLRTFTSGVTELLKAKFIAQSMIPSVFFVNPNYIYNGNRIALIKEFVLKDSEKPVETPENRQIEATPEYTEADQIPLDFDEK